MNRKHYSGTEKVAVLRRHLLEVTQDLVYLPSDIALQPEQAEKLPFDIMALQGRGLVRPEPSWEQSLYRRLGDHPLKPLDLRLIPYFAWANRGPSAMSVWLPVVLTRPPR